MSPITTVAVHRAALTHATLPPPPPPAKKVPQPEPHDQVILFIDAVNRIP